MNKTTFELQSENSDFGIIQELPKGPFVLWVEFTPGERQIMEDGVTHERALSWFCEAQASAITQSDRRRQVQSA